MADQVVTVPILKQTLKEVLGVFRVDLVREIREETHALIAASENRVITLLRGEIQQVKHELQSEIQQSKIEIIEFIDNAIMPQISDLQRDNVVIKRHLKLA